MKRYQVKFLNKGGKIVSETWTLSHVATIINSIEKNKGTLLSCVLKKQPAKNKQLTQSASQ